MRLTLHAPSRPRSRATLSSRSGPTQVASHNGKDKRVPTTIAGPHAHLITHATRSSSTPPYLVPAAQSASSSSLDKCWVFISSQSRVRVSMDLNGQAQRAARAVLLVSLCGWVRVERMEGVSVEERTRMQFKYIPHTMQARGGAWSDHRRKGKRRFIGPAAGPCAFSLVRVRRGNGLSPSCLLRFDRRRRQRTQKTVGEAPTGARLLKFS